MQRTQSQPEDRGLDPEKPATHAAGTEEKQLFAEAQKLLANGWALEGIDCLRRAVELNSNDRVLRGALLNALLDRARMRLNGDWRESQALVREALSMDSSNPAGRSLLAQIQNRERVAMVEACLCEVRELQAAGDLHSALTKVRQALARYPRELHLSQLENTLASRLGSRTQERIPATQRISPPAPQQTQRLNFNPTPAVTSATQTGAATAPQVSPATVLATKPIPQSMPKQPLTSSSALASGIANMLARVKLPSWSLWQWTMLASIPLLLIASLATYKLIKVRRQSAAQLKTELRANIPDVRFFLDGKPVDSPVVLLPGGEHVLQASHEGYESSVQRVTPQAGQVIAPIEFVLNPLPTHLQVWSDLQETKVSVGKEPAATLVNGHLDVRQIAAGTQIVRVFDGGKQIFSIALHVEPGGAVTIAGPLEANNYSVAIASILGTRATIFTTRDLKGNVSGQTVRAIPPEGMEVEIKTALTLHLSNEETINLEPGNQPSVILSIAGKNVETAEVRTSSQVAQLVLSSLPHDAEVHVDGESRGQAMANGTLQLELSPTPHKIYLSRPHFEDSQPITVNLHPGLTERVSADRFIQVQQGSLVFKISPATATASYQLLEPQHTSPAHKAGPGDTVWIKPGRYAIKSEAQGFVTEQAEVEVKPGASLEIQRTLKAVVAVEAPAPSVTAPAKNDPFEDAKLWTKNGSWWIFKKETYGWLKSKDGTFNVVIQRAKKPFYAVWPQGGKRVEWTIDNRDGDRIVYSIINNTFYRTTYRDGKPVAEQSKELKKHPKDYQLAFDVSSRHVVVSEAGNGKLDDVERANPGTPLGKIGFKGEIALTVQQR